MKEFLVGQLDYIFFFYGLAFLVLAGVAFLLHRQEKQPLPWLWLCLFGLAHGIGEWLDLTAIALGDAKVFSAIRVVVMTVSFAFLFEFGRAGLSQLKIRMPGRWIYLPFAAILFCGNIFLAVRSDSQISARYSLGFMGRDSYSGGFCGGTSSKTSLKSIAIL